MGGTIGWLGLFPGGGGGGGGGGTKVTIFNTTLITELELSSIPDLILSKGIKKEMKINIKVMMEH